MNRETAHVIDVNKTVAPCVHLNGTSKDALKNALDVVYHKLEEVRAALKEAMPHGRDYYIGDVLLATARQQCIDRMLLIDNIQDSVTTEMALIDDGIQRVPPKE